MVFEVSALIVFVALVAGSLVAWRRLFRDFKQGIQPLPPRLRAPSPFGLLDALLMFFAWLCLLYTSPSPRDLSTSRMPSSA